MELKMKLDETTKYLKDQGVGAIDVALILGSGLGELAGEIENPVIIKYETIPHFPVSTVVGHAGQLVYGDLSGKKVIAMQGRFHFYEGNTMEVVTYPVRVFSALGTPSIIVTNAAGGVNKDFAPGDLMRGLHGLHRTYLRNTSRNSYGSHDGSFSRRYVNCS